VSPETAWTGAENFGYIFNVCACVQARVAVAVVGSLTHNKATFRIMTSNLSSWRGDCVPTGTSLTCFQMGDGVCCVD
jgi:hypothetical protein